MKTIFTWGVQIQYFSLPDPIFFPSYFLDKNSILAPDPLNKGKITRRTTTSERKQVFASNGKFQKESLREQVAHSN